MRAKLYTPKPISTLKIKLTPKPRKLIEKLAQKGQGFDFRETRGGGPGKRRRDIGARDLVTASRRGRDGTPEALPGAMGESDERDECLSLADKAGTVEFEAVGGTEDGGSD